MKTTYLRLTKSENEIMELLWREGRPLSRSEIIDLTPDRTWKPASIHILLNSMLEKGAIQVAGFVQSTKNYARTFTPTLTADEYAVLQFKHSSAFNEQSVLCLVSALVEDIRASPENFWPLKPVICRGARKGCRVSTAAFLRERERALLFRWRAPQRHGTSSRQRRGAYSGLR